MAENNGKKITQGNKLQNNPATTGIQNNQGTQWLLAETNTQIIQRLRQTTYNQGRQNQTSRRTSRILRTAPGSNTKRQIRHAHMRRTQLLEPRTPDNRHRQRQRHGLRNKKTYP